MRLIWAAAGLTLLCLSAQAQDNEAAWRKTLEEIRPSVVSLRVNKTRPFDTESNTLLDGTGFVVDAQRGIILTNRHIVSTGPVMGEALFANQEEIELERLYADPVHDFGFFRYDPARPPPHPATGSRAGPRSGAARARNPGGGQRRGRTVLDSCRHHRAAGPHRPELRFRPLQRLQHLLYPGRFRHLGRLLGQPGHRYRGPRRGPERGRPGARANQLFPAAGTRPPGAGAGTGRTAGAARRPADHLRAVAVRRTAPAGAGSGSRGGRAGGLSGERRPAGRALDAAGVRGFVRVDAGRHTAADRGRGIPPTSCVWKAPSTTASASR